VTIIGVTPGTVPVVEVASNIGPPGPQGPQGPPGAQVAIQVIDASLGAVQINLPAPNTVSGQSFTYFKLDSSANAVTLHRDLPTTTIQGTQADVVLAQQYDSVTIYASGPTWFIINAEIAPVTITTSQTWVVPCPGQWRRVCIGAGGGGGGAGSALTAGGTATQVGGAGACGGNAVEDVRTLVQGAQLVCVVGAPGPGGVGGAPNSNAGTGGTIGGTTAITTAPQLSALGGRGGANSTANSAATVWPYWPGPTQNVTTGNSTILPTGGGQAQSNSGYSGGPSVGFAGCGGLGGTPAASGLGGKAAVPTNNGNLPALLAPGGAATSTGDTPQSPTRFGDGGFGGGGGAPGGSGGGGANGGPGAVIFQLLAL